MLKYSNHIDAYLEQVKTAMDQAPAAEVDRVVEVLLDAYDRNAQIFVFGNGGSAATASHFACDLGKGAIIEGEPRFRIIALTDNVALMTAWANDYQYDDIFVEQLANLLQPRDIVLGISGSGNSPNVLKAIRYARESGAITIGFCGFAGGKLKDMVDIPVVIPAPRIGVVEDVHLILTHAISICLHDVLVEKGGEAVANSTM